MPEAQLSRRHDQSFKLLFSLPLAVERMIRRFIDSDLADELDFERMENLATERTTPGLIRSQTDLPTLAVTIYNGRERWTAPDDVFDLIEPVRGWLASRQPSLRHEVLDLRALAAQGPTEGSGFLERRNRGESTNVFWSESGHSRRRE